MVLPNLKEAEKLIRKLNSSSQFSARIPCINVQGTRFSSPAYFYLLQLNLLINSWFYTLLFLLFILILELKLF